MILYNLLCHKFLSSFAGAAFVILEHDSPSLYLPPLNVFL